MVYKDCLFECSSLSDQVLLLLLKYSLWHLDEELKPSNNYSNVVKNFTRRTCAISKIFMACWSATRQTVINLQREKSYNRPGAPLSDNVLSPSPVSCGANLRISNFLPFLVPSPSSPGHSFRSRFVDPAIVARRRDVPTFAESATTRRLASPPAMYRVIPSKRTIFLSPWKSI